MELAPSTLSYVSLTKSGVRLSEDAETHPHVTSSRARARARARLHLRISRSSSTALRRVGGGEMMGGAAHLFLGRGVLQEIFLMRIFLMDPPLHSARLRLPPFSDPCPSVREQGRLQTLSSQ